MVKRMKHIRPRFVSGESVVATLGRPWTCPWCRSETTASDTAEDIGWVETPLRQSSPPYVCLGCCEDIYSTCVASDFKSHPYHDIVVDAAAVEGVSVQAFRRTCVEHQLELLTQRGEMEVSNYSARLAVITAALSDSSKD